MSLCFAIHLISKSHIHELTSSLQNNFKFQINILKSRKPTSASVYLFLPIISDPHRPLTVLLRSLRAEPRDSLTETAQPYQNTPVSSSRSAMRSECPLSKCGRGNHRSSLFPFPQQMFRPSKMVATVIALSVEARELTHWTEICLPIPGITTSPVKTATPSE